MSATARGARSNSVASLGGRSDTARTNTPVSTVPPRSASSAASALVMDCEPCAYPQTVIGLYRRLRRLLRRVGLSRGMLSRSAPKPRAAAVVIDGDKVLVMKRHKRGRDYAVLPGGGVEAGETFAEAALRELIEETTLVAEIDRLLWTGMHNDRPASYFLMTAVRGYVELSGPEALANRPDNSFELRWATADQFAELGLHPQDIRGPLAALLASRADPI